MNIEKMIEEIKAGIDPSWDRLTIIRYVYIEVGKRISRDTDFFFSVDEKLGDANLSIKELEEIYDSEYGREDGDICKSASKKLKKVYDSLGIESILIQSNNNYQELMKNGKKVARIFHWFLAVIDGSHTYFLTLNSDLPNIQMGLKTEHFATRINYEKVINGEKIQVYKGPKIEETVLDDKLIASLDRRIGYVNTYYKYDSNNRKTKKFELQYNDAAFEMLKEEMRKNKLYYELLTIDSDFYYYFLKIKDNNGKTINLLGEKFADIPDDICLKWKKKICKVVVEKIEKIIGADLNMMPFLNSKEWNYDIWLMKLCVLCEDKIINYYDYYNEVDPRPLRVDVGNFKFSKWSSNIKDTFRLKNNNFDYNSVLTILDKLNALMGAIDRRDGKAFNKIYSLLAFHFIPSIAIPENNIDENGYLSNEYIANKFQKLFINTFSCNSIKTPFNDMKYSEQVVIIKKVLEILFPEVNYDNSSDLVSYNDSYSPVMNRIHIYPVKSERSGNYSIVFNIIGNGEEGDYYFFYNPRENTFKVADALEIYNDYIVISERMKDRFNVESMERLGAAK